MTLTEKTFLSETIVAMFERGARGRGLCGDTLCLFCGKPISEREFLLMRCGDDEYTIGCIHCLSARESLPSVNPFLFSGSVRRCAN